MIYSRRMRTGMWCLIIALISGCATGNRGQRVLWIGAHPDDEIFAAPLLASLCHPPNRCSFLVMTAGERGACRLAAACGDIATLRSSEVREAARLFGAGVTQWTLADGSAWSPHDVLTRWSHQNGGCATLVAAVGAQMSEADLVLTFDPEHGTTMHADHRATAMLVAAALTTLHQAPPAYALAVRATMGKDGSTITFQRHTGGEAPLQSTPANWRFVLGVAHAHRSQFNAAALDILETTPAEARAIRATPLAPASIDCRGR